MIFREIKESDLDELLIVRSSTDENRLTIEELNNLGINSKTTSEKMQHDLKGWLCEVDNRIVGFSMGFAETGEMWVIAVLPDYIQKGIGTNLLSRIEKFLFQHNEEIWLTTDIDTNLRAYSFYKSNGWQDKEIRDGERIMVKTNIQTKPIAGGD